MRRRLIRRGSAAASQWWWRPRCRFARCPPASRPWLAGQALPAADAVLRIRSNGDLNSIPIIAVTSYALAGDDAKALAAGCNAYITKPYSPKQLLAKVR